MFTWTCSFSRLAITRGTLGWVRPRGMPWWPSHSSGSWTEYYLLSPSLSTTPHLYELARGAPEHVVVELPHLLPHHPVELGRAVLALLHHGAVHQTRHLFQGGLLFLSLFQIKTVVTLGTMASTWCSSTDSSSISRSTTPKCVLLSAWNTLGFSPPPSAPGLAASLAPALAPVP